MLGSGATGTEREGQLRASLALPQPKVIDAAALNLAAFWICDNGPLSPADILTPHAGELEGVLQLISLLAPTRWQDALGSKQRQSELILKLAPLCGHK